MRITGGILRGRQIRVPRGAVRPTQDRVRAALFNILGARVKGARFLDLFAGSGAVGIEAWSRGATRVCWVESDRETLKVLRENVRSLCPDAGPVVGWDVRRFLTRRPDAPFDIIFCDPPYLRRRAGESSGGSPRDRQPDRRLPWRHWLLGRPGVRGLIARDGILVVEERVGTRDHGQAEGWRLWDDRSYGQTRLLFFAPFSESEGRLSSSNPA